MANFKSMKRDLLAECADDHVSLSSVIGYVEDEIPGASESKIRQTTLDLLYELLKSGQIQAGFPDTNGRDFHQWPFDANVIIEKIKGLWNSNGSRPKPGDVVWFTAQSDSPARV